MRVKAGKHHTVLKPKSVKLSCVWCWSPICCYTEIGDQRATGLQLVCAGVGGQESSRPGPTTINREYFQTGITFEEVLIVIVCVGL